MVVQINYRYWSFFKGLLFTFQCALYFLLQGHFLFYHKVQFMSTLFLKKIYFFEPVFILTYFFSYKLHSLYTPVEKFKPCSSPFSQGVGLKFFQLQRIPFAISWLFCLLFSSRFKAFPTYSFFTLVLTLQHSVLLYY